VELQVAEQLAELSDAEMVGTTRRAIRVVKRVG
jgi:hypothetical protein